MFANFCFADTTPGTSESSGNAQVSVSIVNPEGTSIYNNAGTFDGLITQDFSADVGLDASGNPIPTGTNYWDGTDIFSDGIDMDFSSPQASNPVFVTTNPRHPELGPVGPNGEYWCGTLRFDFDVDVTAVGFGTHLLGPVKIILLNRDSSELSSTVWDAGSQNPGFIGIIDDQGFASVLLETDNCFWSIDEVRGETFPLLPVSPLDHFKCYKVEGEKIKVNVNLEDQFGIQEKVIVIKPLLLCNPVIKWHDDEEFPVKNPEEHLVCYNIKPATKGPNVVVNNQFGERQILKVIKSKYLCVPSKKFILLDDSSE